MSRLIDTGDMDAGRVERPNKSQIKREIHALHDLARKLVDMDDAELDAMELGDPLRREIALARTMKHGALKRQLKFITRLLREQHAESILETVAGLESRKQVQDAAFHRIERWRDRLLAEGDAALTELLQAHPEADAGQIRQLMRNAAREAAAGKPPKSSRALFRLLRGFLG